MPVTVQHSIIDGGYAGTSNLNTDPLFVDPAAGDYRLLLSSPASGLGTLGALPAGTLLDLGHQTRVRGGIPDAGAYETQQDCPSGSPILYVKKTAAPGGNGFSWASAFADLNAAIAFAKTCPRFNEIWVATGTYIPTTTGDRYIAFEFDTDVKVFGGFAGTETAREQRNPDPSRTVLSGHVGPAGNAAGNSYSVVITRGVTRAFVMDGFTISGGRATFYTGNDVSVYGAGWFNVESSSQGYSEPTITNCVFTDNQSFYLGGAIYSSGKEAGRGPLITDCAFRQNQTNTGAAICAGNSVNQSQLITIERCTFSDNRSSSGGAIGAFAGGSLAVTNCLFIRNLAEGEGAAIFSQGNGSTTVTNCTFVDQDTYRDGVGAYQTSGELYGGGTRRVGKITNCLFWGGRALPIVDPAIITTDVTYSSVLGGWPGVGNVSNVPGFTNAAAGDYSLAPGSPAIDAGSTAAVPSGTTKDFAGNPRVSGLRVDFGAYERAGSVLTIQGKVLLEGLYDASTQRMSTRLLTDGVLPLNQPYAALGHPRIGPGFDEDVASADILRRYSVSDWAYIELRSSASPGVVAAARAGLLLHDGRIVATDGVSPVRFSGVLPGEYHVTVRHRNHLAATTTAITLTAGAPGVVDFSSLSTATLSSGADAQKLIAGKLALFGGDANGDGTVNAVDLNEVWRPSNGQPYNYGASGADFNGDGVINALDLNTYFLPNNGRSEQRF